MENYTDGQRERERSRRGDKPSRFSDAKPRDRSHDKGTRENRVFISNIPYEYKWADLKDLFRIHVGGTTYVELFTDDNNKPRGCGIVEFSSPEFVKKALEVMHRFPLEGRKLVVKEEVGHDRNIFGPSRDDRDDKGMRNDSWNNGNSVGNNMDGERFNTYGLSLQFLDSINVRGPLINRLFVANLDYKVDKTKLKEVFKMAGKVRNVDLCLDKDRNSRGFAIIEYDHPVEAVQAISMFDKQLLFDRKLAVRMDRAGHPNTEVRLPEGLVAVGPGLGPNGEPLRDVVRNLPSQQTTTQSGQVTGAGAAGAGLLGAVPALGGLGLQALGQLGLGQLQSQLLQQGLGSSDISSMGNTGLGSSAMNLQDMTSGSHSQQGASMGGNNYSNNSYQDLNKTAFGRMGSGVNPNLSSLMSTGLSPNVGYPHQSSGRLSPNAMQYGDHSGRSNLGNSDKPADMIIIRYLPQSVTWQLLREKFGEAGEVKFAEKIDNESAVIRFASEWGAARAIKMFDKTRIDGQTIAVRNF